jgi:cell division protein FtsZ
MIELDSTRDRGAKIRVIGVGGGGGNAVNSMIYKGLVGVDFIAINTYAQALEKNLANTHIHIGGNVTRGLGAGADPEVGLKAVEEDRDAVAESIAGSDMVFVTAGMGGGTGTGGAPIVANIARSVGALVVGIVTNPFAWEGKRRMQQAEQGIAELKKHVDTLIVIPNQKLLTIVDKHTPLLEAFEIANSVLHNATRGIADLITVPGLVNVDFADVRTIMHEIGDELMGTGLSKGDNRAVEAAHNAISSPLLDGISITGAQGVLVNITGSPSLSLSEVSEAAEIIHDNAGDDANISFVAVIDETLNDEMFVTVIATGFSKASAAKQARVEKSGMQRLSDRKTDHVPSGTLELKEFDIPAYQRRSGIDLGSVSLNEANTAVGEPEAMEEAAYIPRLAAEARPAASEPRVNREQHEQRDPADRPAFLKRIMD